MLIGVISDTHIPERSPEIPEAIFDIFDEVEMILHAGDLVSAEVREELETVAPTRCVQGNMDRVYGMKLPFRDLIQVEGVKIGLDHGEVYPRGDEQQLKYIGMEMEVDVLISGHTHWPFIKEVNKVILLNPGSPTVPRMSDPSIMLLEVQDKELGAKIVKIGDSTCKAITFQREGSR